MEYDENLSSGNNGQSASKSPTSRNWDSLVKGI